MAAMGLNQKLQAVKAAGPAGAFSLGDKWEPAGYDKAIMGKGVRIC